MKYILTLFTLSTSLLSYVSAHGYVQSIEVEGKTYSGWIPFQDEYSSPAPARITRKIPNDGPVGDYTSNDIICNTGAPDKAGAQAPIDAGKEVTFKWNQWPGEHKGPIVTSMARCGDDSCDGYEGTGEVWFKIHQLGLISSGDNGNTWASDKLIQNGLKWTVTVPESLKPGAYLIRTEILAMHSTGSPQFYPSCSQLTVSGSGSATPSSSELYDLTEVYKNADESTKTNIWQRVDSYKIAGPSVVSFAAGEDSTDDDTSTEPSSSSPAPTSTRTRPTSSTSVRNEFADQPTSTSAGGSGSGSGSSSSDSPKTCRAKSKRSASVARRHVGNAQKRSPPGNAHS